MRDEFTQRSHWQRRATSRLSCPPRGCAGANMSMSLLWSCFVAMAHAAAVPVSIHDVQSLLEVGHMLVDWFWLHFLASILICTISCCVFREAIFACSWYAQFRPWRSNIIDLALTVQTRTGISSPRSDKLLKNSRWDTRYCTWIADKNYKLRHHAYSRQVDGEVFMDLQPADFEDNAQDFPNARDYHWWEICVISNVLHVFFYSVACK